MDGAPQHQPVLLAEVVALLRPAEGKVIVDATLGLGGHAEALLRAGATVRGFDRDPDALALATARLAAFGERCTPRRGDFRDLADLLDAPVDGVLLDLGVSSLQLDAPGRGFSFREDGPLDMRMSGEGMTAAELVAEASESDLADIIFHLGDERFARKIAARLKAALPTTTGAAAEAVKRAVPRAAWPRHHHVATRTFQALRMAVNHERESLEAALAALPAVLAPGGRAAVISFHSIEDRAVKVAFRALCAADDDRGAAAPRFAPLTKKPVVPSDAELASNARSRSAKLRAVERMA